MHKLLKEELDKKALKNKNYYAYILLIEKALSENRIKLDLNDPKYVYYEAHHILPRCLFKDYITVSDNIVLLTAREHLKAHYYLTEIFNNKGLDFAYWRLCTDNRGREVTPEEYEKGKLLAIKRSSEINKNRKHTTLQTSKMLQTKQKNGTLKHSPETRRKISISNSGKKFSDEHRKNISLSKQGKSSPKAKWSTERKKCFSEKRKGKNNPMYGKHLKDLMTTENYAKRLNRISEKLTGHETSRDTRLKISQKLKLSSAFIGGRNPKAKKIKCLEDGSIFNTLKDCSAYYEIPLHLMTKVAKEGFYKPINKHFKIL